MDKKRLTALAAALAAGLLALSSHDSQAAKKSIIFDTDWWTDVDDACALRMVLDASREGRAELLGICLSAMNSTSVRSIRKFIVNEGSPLPPIGADTEATDYKGRPKYHSTIIDNVAERVPEEAEDCVSFYRRLLAGARGKVDIIAVGYPNALAKLLASAPDEYSPLDGKTLVRRKVGRLYLMAGKYPCGTENNFHRGERSRKAGAYLCREWPGSIVFLGYEVGIQVRIGGSLDGDDLLKKVLVAHGSGSGRYAWDPMTVQIALGGSLAEEGYRAVRGRNYVEPDEGGNFFIPAAFGRHRYVVMTRQPQWYEERLEKLIRR